MNQKPSIRQNTGKLNLLLRFMRGSILLFLASVVFAALIALADMIIPQIIRVTVDNILGGSPEPPAPAVQALLEAAGGYAYLRDHLWIMACAVIAVAAVKVVSQYLYAVSSTAASETLVKSMRDSLYAQILHLPLSWHAENHTGDIIQRCTSDIEYIRAFVSEQMTNLFRIVILIVLAMSFMFSMHPGLTWIAMIPLPLLFFFSIRFYRQTSSCFQECDESEGRLSAMTQENLTGVRVVRAFGRERYEKDRFEAQNQAFTALWERLASVMSQFWCTSDFLSGFQIMLVVVFGAVFCIRGTMTSGEYIAFISYNSMLLWPIRQLGMMVSEMSKANVSLQRIQYIMDSKAEQTRPHALTPPMDRDICFRNINYAFAATPPVLHDIDLTIPAGSTLGILGSTGSGKSTLMMLLDKLYELPKEQGTITIGGVDIRDIDTEYLRRNIGMVLQESFLFSRSIAENISISRKGLSPAQIREAARTACLDETIRGFAKGYDTFVGERGVTLSGGQKQRAAIARTLALNTPILIFDDSLSAVDTQTDAKIRANLEARFGRATVILISHRITTLAQADQILVLDRGGIAQLGTHEELRSAGGIYQKIYEIQSGSRKEAP